MNRIKSLRQEAGLKQYDLAESLGVRQQAISKYESETIDLDTDTIRRLCAIFGCTADYLLGMSDQRTPEISDEDAALVEAYHALSPELRQAVDSILATVRGEAGAAEHVS